MLAKERTPLSKARGRNSFHGDSGLGPLNHQSRTKAQKRHTQHFFGIGAGVGSGGATGDGVSQSRSSHQQQPCLSRSHSRHRSQPTVSGATTATARLSTTSPESAVAKEKEFMANTRILAMSNLIDSFTSGSHMKQGFYGKQLKIVGSTTTSASATGVELDLTVKVCELVMMKLIKATTRTVALDEIHVIENTWTTCPLLPTSTILHRWKITYLDDVDQRSNDLVQEDYGADVAYSRDEKDASWVQAIAERTEALSPAPSPTHDQSARRPLSISSVSSYSGQSTAPQTHVAVLSNALCFVANRAGDYLVHLTIHAPFVASTGSRGIHLSSIPKCRSNFIKFQVRPTISESEKDVAQSGADAEDGAFDALEYQQAQVHAATAGSDGFEFNIHPKVMSLDEAHLNPDSDEDAQFWLEVQELLVGSDRFVGTLISSDNPESEVDNHEQADDMRTDGNQSLWEIAGCFAPSSSLHLSWIPRDAVEFIQDLQQEMVVNITGLPDQTKSSTLLQDRKRKDPEESHVVDQNDHDEDPFEYEHLEMDDGDLVISAASLLTLNVQKLGWKQPFFDFTIELEDMLQSHGHAHDISLVDISGSAVQDWEDIKSSTFEQHTSTDHDGADKESNADHDRQPPSAHRVWLFAGTEGMTTVHVSIRIAQAVSVGYGKDILCNIPKIRVHGATADKGRIQIHTSNDFVIQRCNTRLLEASPTESHLQLEESQSTRHQPTLRFQYSSVDHQLTVIVQRYQALSRIARIERVRAEIGVGGQQQPGFARIVLSNIVLPQQDDPYLRVYQLDGAEVWNVLVDGKPSAKSIQFMDRKSAGQRTVLVPIPDESSKSDNLHQVEISYGFNTFEREQNDCSVDEPASPSIKLVVPGFNLPVGEYVVVASLPKLAQDMDYDEPTGDFEVMSSLGKPGQRRTITYGAYMTLGRPKLSIRTTKVSVDSRGRRQEALREGPDHIDQPVVDTRDQITRTPAVAHDPQQPPFNPGIVATHQASQRHPQQPLELQNPQAEQVLDGEILPVLSTRANGSVGSSEGGVASNLAPQVGSPAIVRRSQGSFWTKQLSYENPQDMIRQWWKPVVASVVALLLVIMIANAAAFQETKSTSLDLISVPAWQRPFAAIGRLWRDSSLTQRQVQQDVLGGGGDEDGSDDCDEYVQTEAVTVKQAHKHLTETLTLETETTQDLKVRTASDSYQGIPFESEDVYGDGQGKKQHQPGGIAKLFHIIKKLVRDLQS
ncbi:hypothetical protein EDD11_005230 [Mortierella claussenii]|nr:hypothetical protein EDD11_005230 [Mortierella claussenii]